MGAAYAHSHVKISLGMRMALSARGSTKDKGQDMDKQLYQLGRFAARPGEFP
jgi:hypothetical protein